MARRNAGAAVTDRVQAAAVLHAECGPGTAQDADTRSCLGLRLPRRHRHRRVLRIGAAPQDRCVGTASAAHPARRGLRHAAPGLLARTKPMAHPTPAPRLWRSVKDLPGRTPLRIKLIAAVLALVTAALAVISIAGIAFLRSYLLGQVDDQLHAAALYGNASSTVNTYLFFGDSAAQPGYGGLSILWLPEHGQLQQVVAEYPGFRAGQLHPVPGPQIKRSY